MSKLFKGRGQSDKDHEKQQPKAAFLLRVFGKGSERQKPWKTSTEKSILAERG